MMRTFGVISVVLALAKGYFVLQQSVGSGPGQAPPQEQIDVVAIRQRLLSIGQAERHYLATHGTYATLEQLSREELLPGGWPTLEIRETMPVTLREAAH